MPGYGIRFALLSAGAFVLMVFGAASASAGKPAFVGQGWGTGIEALLPANAATSRTLGATVSSVSCASVGNCSAVGTYVDNEGNPEGLLLTETAGTWEPGVEAILPYGAVPDAFLSLQSISCASAGNCSAVGVYDSFSHNIQGLLLTESGGSWSVGLQASLPDGAISAGRLPSVSCASVGNCTAVGFFNDANGDTHSMLLTEKAGTWANGIEPSLPADAAGTAGATVVSVSCASAGDCTAVGDYRARSGERGLLLTETDGKWMAVRALLPKDAPWPRATFLDSVSCASAGNCGAVGFYGSNGLLLTERAGTWSRGVRAVLPADAEPGLTEINAVSCASPGDCSAVGTYEDRSYNTQGLLLTEAAGNWGSGAEVQSAITGLNETELDSVSCASPGNCSAVGTDGSDSVGLLLAETAGRWSLGTDTRLPANASANHVSRLFSVSCPAPGNCSAVGDYVDGQPEDQGLLVGESSPIVTLDISKNGTGSGRVSDLLTGIQCGPICSTSLAAGASLTLTATPAMGARFSGWSGGGCMGIGTCQLSNVASDQTVTATFDLLPSCVVPELKGKSLKAARRAIGRHNCTLGSISLAASQTIKVGHVISQQPKAGRRLPHGTAVNLVVSRGEP